VNICIVFAIAISVVHAKGASEPVAGSHLPGKRVESLDSVLRKLNERVEDIEWEKPSGVKVDQVLTKALEKMTACTKAKDKSGESLARCLRAAKQELPQTLYNIYYPHSPQKVCNGTGEDTAAKKTE
jgi:hypothetical protein